MNDTQNDLPAAEGEALLETPALHPSLPMDEFHGVAGSYLFDPATGKRTPVVDAD